MEGYWRHGGLRPVLRSPLHPGAAADRLGSGRRGRSSPDPTSVRRAVLCQQGLQFFADRHAALRAMSAAAVAGGRLALATWTEPEETIACAALADALELYVGPDAGARMRQPWALEDPSTLAGILERAGLDQIEVSQHTRTARFAWRDDFARRLVLATPLAWTFIDAADDRRPREAVAGL